MHLTTGADLRALQEHSVAGVVLWSSTTQSEQLTNRGLGPCHGVLPVPSLRALAPKAGAHTSLAVVLGFVGLAAVLAAIAAAAALAPAAALLQPTRHCISFLP